jgi:two-component system cell cycle sensor histidine kinase/response regulator CckA
MDDQQPINQDSLPSAPSTRSDPSRCPRQTILLVDDEKVILEVTTRLLGSLGFDVLPARQGEDALRLFSEHRQSICLALVDLTMPKMSGEEIVRELCRLTADLPVVMMSGYPESDVLTSLPGVRLAGYLQKPFRLPVVLELLKRLNLIEE